MCLAAIGAGGVMRGHAVLIVVDRCDLSIEADEVADLASEALCDHIHASNRLKHGGEQGVIAAGEQSPPDLRLKDVVQAQWR